MLKKLDKMEIMFIFIYFVEQIALILLYVVKSSLIHVWISIFPVIFLTTMAIEKVLLKADYQEKIDNYIQPKKDEIERDKQLKKLKKLWNKQI